MQRCSRWGWLLTHALASGVEPWDDDAARWFADQRGGELTETANASTFLGETQWSWRWPTSSVGAISMWQRSLRPAVFFAVVVAGFGGF